MNLADTLRGLWRRWYIVLPGILLTAVCAAGTWSVVPPGHERSSTQLLIPGAQSMPVGANPYLFLGGLSPAADVLVRAVGSENEVNDVVADYPGVEIEISRDTSTAGPVILIAVTAENDNDAAEVLGLLVDRTASVLNELQETENIAAENRVTLLPITVDSQSVLEQRSRFIAVAATGLVGMAFTLVLAGLVDGLSQHRKRRRELQAQQDQKSDRSAEAQPGPTTGTGGRGVPASERSGIRDGSEDDTVPAPAATPVPSSR
jgi:capsular polysaccharide biosynthesis protein